jgi:hypothetical protein
MSRLTELDTAVQELRVDPQHEAFIHTLARVVTWFGEIPDLAPGAFTPDQMTRLRELAEETVGAVEWRLQSDVDDEKTQEKLAGTVYEIRRRMEAAEAWFTHFEG